MLWLTLVQSGTPRQAETTIEAKNPGRNPGHRDRAGVSPVRAGGGGHHRPPAPRGPGARESRGRSNRLFTPASLPTRTRFAVTMGISRHRRHVHLPHQTYIRRPVSFIELQIDETHPCHLCTSRARQSRDTSNRCLVISEIKARLVSVSDITKNRRFIRWTTP